MKLSSTLVKAMLITATIGVTAACTSTKKVNSDSAKSRIEKPEAPTGMAGNCPACGRG